MKDKDEYEKLAQEWLRSEGLDWGPVGGICCQAEIVSLAALLRTVAAKENERIAYNVERIGLLDGIRGDRDAWHKLMQVVAEDIRKNRKSTPYFPSTPPTTAPATPPATPPATAPKTNPPNNPAIPARKP